MDDKIIHKKTDVVVFDAPLKRQHSNRQYQRSFMPTAPIRQNGFTLVEVLIVLVILGLATSLVVLNLPPANQNTRREAQRFEARLIAASSEAVTSGEIIGLNVTSDQYSFLHYTRGTWAPLEGRVFSAWTLDSDIMLNVEVLETDSLRENDKIISGGGTIIRTVNDVRRDTIKAPIIQFHPIGDNTEFQVRFTGSSQSWLVSHSVTGVINIALVGEGT